MATQGPRLFLLLRCELIQSVVRPCLPELLSFDSDSDQPDSDFFYVFYCFNLETMFSDYDTTINRKICQMNEKPSR